MVVEENKVIKEIRVDLGDQEDQEHPVVKENPVMILKEDLVDQEILAFQEEMEKMVLLEDQEPLDKREIVEREILARKIMQVTRILWMR